MKTIEADVKEMIKKEFAHFVYYYHTEPNVVMIPSTMKNEFYCSLSVPNEVAEYNNKNKYYGMDVLFTSIKSKHDKVRVAFEHIKND